eukprot:CAMPEP_0172515414 /NCGR_PEP_ID=MMETSP1066-20121228/267810_1 /TAXON_ID=671091 /ORGANISM="Coscinodiscus wailesii, Strain CCMP2513" /LENGTH=234 /DNA_ID=CAMNT_0013296465 /DNA_START=181 /DNA_END=882 /DNA_ORIENTATION=+
MTIIPRRLYAILAIAASHFVTAAAFTTPSLTTFPHRRSAVITSSPRGSRAIPRRDEVKTVRHFPSSVVTAVTPKDDDSATTTTAANVDFWTKQQELANAMKDVSERQERSAKEEQKAKYSQRLLGLVGDTFFYAVMIFSALWLFTGPLTPISYLFGAIFGTAYSYGLGKYVETLGGSVDDAGAVGGAGVGQARFAFLILLFVVVGKFRGQGVQEIPAIMGFFTYQLASLGQGLR